MTDTSKVSGLPPDDDVAEIANARLREAIGLRLDDEPDRARAVCEQLLAEFPDYVGALYTAGMTYVDQQDYARALPCFVQAAMHNPDDFRVMTNLAGTYAKLGASRMAALTYETALSLNDAVPEIHHNLAKIYRERREYARAAACFERTLQLAPRTVVSAYFLAGCYESLGRLDEAAAMLHQVHEWDPVRHEVLFALSGYPASKVRLDLVDAIRATETRETPDDAGDFRIELNFALARALDQRGTPDDAWPLICDANRLHSAKHQVNYEANRKRQIEIRDWAMSFPAVVPGDGGSMAGGATSLFILGPSRSGKTSLERLVGALPGTHSGYENPIISDTVTQTNQMSGRLSLAAIAELPDDLYGDFAANYTGELAKRVAGAALFINTLPGLIADVPRLIAAVPRARFVFIRRNIDDIVLRMFFQRYRRGNAYAYNIANAYDYLRWYYKLIDIWVGKYSSLATVVDYEDMAACPANVLDRIARFCGLDAVAASLPDIGDDRGCAQPYLEQLRAIAGRK